MRFTFTLLMSLIGMAASAQQPVKVAGFPATTQSVTRTRFLSHPVVLNGNLFFPADDGLTGTELYKSDGTANGTVLLKDVRPGAEASFPSFVTAAGAHVFFAASDGTNGQELWKSDGTPGGTRLLKDLTPGGSGSYFRAMAASGNYAYAIAYNGGQYPALWRSDGTEAGTVKIMDGVYEQYFAGLNGSFYFTAATAAAYSGLYRVDENQTAPVLVKSVAPSHLTAVGNTLYFGSFDGTGHVGLWKSDGTEAGTVLVKPNVDPRGFARLNGTTYFYARYNGFYFALWRTDGTSAGTVLIKDGFESSNDQSFAELTPMNGALYFRAQDQAGNDDLWRSDGTAAGTTKVTEINPGTGTMVNELTVLNGKLYFGAVSPGTGYELWTSDGTAPGTRLVRDLLPGPASGSASGLTVMGNALYFGARDYAHGYELRKTDGTAAGTTLVKDINAQPNLQAVNNPVSLDSTLHFTVNHYQNLAEGWLSDGTAAGTQRVTHPGGQRASLTRVGNRAFFLTPNGADKVELWVQDQSGTQRVMEFGTDNLLFFHALTAVGDELFFTFGPSQLWKSDGTEAGTVLVKAFPVMSQCTNLVAAGNHLYFTVDDGPHGNELWKSNGTATGTVLVKDIEPGFGSAYPRNLVAFNNALYFTAHDGAFCLWRTDGTEAGTTKVLNPATNAPLVEAMGPRAAGKYLFFSARLDTTGSELWRTDGSPGGAVLVKDLTPGPEGTYVNNLTAWGDLFYFSTENTVWKSDGTAAGTVPVKDVNPENVRNNHFLSSFTPTDEYLYFVYANTFLDRVTDLWRTDGTAAGTVQLHTFYGSPSATGDARLTAVGNTIYFSDCHRSALDELWKLTTTNTPPTLGTLAARLLQSDSSLVVALRIGDGESPAENLSVTATADNVVLFPAGNIVVGGAGADRTLALTPARGASGQAIITVTVSDGTLQQQQSFAVTVAAPVVSGLDDAERAAPLHLYPNPTRADCILLLPDAGGLPVRVRLYDALGQPLRQHLLSAGTRQFRMRTADLRPGRYLLEVQTGDAVIRRGLVKY